MDEQYKNDPRYKQLMSYVSSTGDISPMQEYLDAQGINQPPYKYRTFEEYANDTGDVVPWQDYEDNLNNYNDLMSEIYRQNLGNAHGYPEGTDMYYEYMDPDASGEWYSPEDLDEDFGYYSDDPMDFYNAEALSDLLTEQGYYDNPNEQDIINWFRKARNI